MPEPLAESPQLTHERHTALGAIALVCLALPTVALLVLDVPNSARSARAAWLAGTTLAAAVLALLYWAPYRALGLVPCAAVAWGAAAAHGAYWHEWPGWAHGVPVGLIVGALARARRGPELPWEPVALLGAVGLGCGIVWAVVQRGRPFQHAEWFCLGTALALTAWTWARLFRPLFELASEPVLWLMYHVRGAGPGLADLPRTGPCLIIANHACWLDPLFLAKVTARPLTPMMTSRFYDMPVIRRLMVAFGVIRVPERALKKDAPEIREAIAALDRGECVVVFPEGYLRRTEDRPLRRFGQGVWQVLKARPGTPVFAAWIEGGWGSYTSYAQGPPMRNKTKDVRRPIGVGVSAAVVAAPGVLEEHLRTRTHLMNLVSAARAHLGLAPLPPFELPIRADENDAE
ncbi:lysophospholipid acyltransferase family protein [Frigoriglobus tundricola]|uniref:2-acyl-glycerophospho-ethanolamine acyltransferase n=1 Tax=Frigoriglobus tundricola TaxID=2774151 RepID=A0A6M5YN54_9BACT|nr:lysophospholipid acyltransferase family protein [Frigoriglobus tundricola]QJW94766.1 2-acyl-glycerophospho-ethanolamine acyltransferase [Frigoriglobus tundricola]